MHKDIKVLGEMYLELCDEIKRLTAERNKIQAGIELLASTEIENRTLKSLNIAEVNGRVLRVSEKKTLNLLNDVLLAKVIGGLFGTVMSVKVKKEVKFADNNFKEAVIALMTEDYNEKMEPLEDVIDRVFPHADAKTKKVLFKKLSIDTKKNISQLKSLFDEGNFEEEILEIKLAKNRELIGRYFEDEDLEEAKKKLKRACGIGYSITTTVIESEEENE